MKRDIVILCDLYDATLTPRFDNQIQIYKRLEENFNVLILPYLKNSRIYKYTNNKKAVPLRYSEKLNDPIFYPRFSGAPEKGLKIYNRLNGTKLEDGGVLEISTSKILSNKAFIDAGINIPKTIFSSDITKVTKEHFEQYPVIKYEFGYRGKSVFMPNNFEDYKELTEGQNFILQERIETESVFSIRVNIVNGKIASSYKVNGISGRKVSNSGEAEIYKLSDCEQKLALKAAKAIPLKIAGIDILKDVNGKLYVLEVNTCPSLELAYGLYKTEGDKFADRIVEFIESKYLEK